MSTNKLVQIGEVKANDVQREEPGHDLDRFNLGVREKRRAGRRPDQRAGWYQRTMVHSVLSRSRQMRAALGDHGGEGHQGRDGASKG